MNNQVNAQRFHIGFYGACNVGKSSLVNAFTKQEVSITSNIRGTTTDPIKKAMELLPIGPILISDTPGFDDNSILGKQRILKVEDSLKTIHLAILVIDVNIGLQEIDNELINRFNTLSIPYIIVKNKSDLLTSTIQLNNNEVLTNIYDNNTINNLKQLIIDKYHTINKEDKFIIRDLINKDDIVILVTPIDSAAPKNRLILPQVQTIREVLDTYAICIVVQVEQLSNTIKSLKYKPNLVVCDSQAFKEVNNILDSDINLTSFSILFARYKGNFNVLLNGSNKIDSLDNNANILISEGCSHHTQCDDIGTIKLPRLLKEYTNKDINFEFTNGNSYKRDLSKYDLIIHCGGCMLNDITMNNRINDAINANVNITNYGLVLAKINGILDRSVHIIKSSCK